MIQGLVHKAGMPAGAGLRLARRDDHTALGMRLTSRPAHGDVVVIEHGASVFLGPLAARKVQHQELDAKTTSTSAAFFLRDHPEAVG